MGGRRRRLAVLGLPLGAAAVLPAAEERVDPLGPRVEAGAIEQCRALAGLEQLAGQLGQERRFRLVLGAAGDTPPAAAGQVEALARPRHPDVEQAALFLDVLGCTLRIEV